MRGVAVLTRGCPAGGPGEYRVNTMKPNARAGTSLTQSRRDSRRDGTLQRIDGGRMTIKEAKKKIMAIEDGPYSHNICGLILRQVSKEHGVGAANKLIDELDLHDLYGISKVQEKDKA